MLSLIELAKEGKLEKTGAKPKLPIKVDGVSSETLDVYKIPLEYVYYNDKNGRIATGISQYRDELHPANDQEDPQYNNFVAKLIEQDNSSALKRTEKSIQESGQQVYGYVLDDGRIVDGNRRYTAYVIFTKRLDERFILRPLFYHSHMTTLLNELKLRNWNWPFRWVLKRGKIMTRWIWQLTFTRLPVVITQL